MRSWISHWPLDRIYMDFIGLCPSLHLLGSTSLSFIPIDSALLTVVEAVWLERTSQISIHDLLANETSPFRSHGSLNPPCWDDMTSRTERSPGPTLRRRTNLRGLNTMKFLVGTPSSFESMIIPFSKRSINCQILG